MNKLFAVLGAILALFSSTVTVAQEIRSNPVLVGASWQYKDAGGRLIDQKVESVVADGVFIRSGISGSGRSGLAKYTPEMNIVSSASGQVYTPFVPSYTAQMAVGREWVGNYSYKRSDGKTVNVKMVARVSHIEDVTVPAGTFKAAVVKRRGDYVVEGGYSNYFEDTSWYSPEMGIQVKNEFIDWGGGSRQIGTTVLMRFKTSPEAVSMVQ
jgi:hypothetical protein